MGGEDEEGFFLGGGGGGWGGGGGVLGGGGGGGVGGCSSSPSWLHRIPIPNRAAQPHLRFRGALFLIPDWFGMDGMRGNPPPFP